MHHFTSRRFRSLLAGCVGAALSVPSFAAIGTIAEPYLVVRASNAAGTGTWTAPASSLQEFPPGSGSYRLLQLTPISIVDDNSGDFVATLQQATLFLNPDPQVSLGFAAMAGNSNTIFSITSALIGFPGINPATGEASAAMTYTDVNGNGGGLTGNGPGGGSYLAHYNGYVPGGTSFADVIPMLSSGGSTADSANIGPLAIGGSVVDMSAQFTFTLTANDLASGTSNFTITPEPTSLMLLGLGLLALRRR